MHAWSRSLQSARGEEIVVFSGAGLSADSGIPTFRDGATGLWNNVDPDEVASIEGFLRNPQRAWSWLLQLKALVDDRRPNAGHQAIARLEEICAAQQIHRHHPEHRRLSRTRRQRERARGPRHHPPRALPSTLRLCRRLGQGCQRTFACPTAAHRYGPTW
jgi:hypothetical protein